MGKLKVDKFNTIIKLGDNNFLAVVRDSGDYIITAGGFSTVDDAEMAIAMLNKVFLDFENGYVKKTVPLQDFLKDCGYKLQTHLDG